MKLHTFVTAFVLTAAVNSCSLMQPGHQRVFAFENDHREKKMVFRLPNGQYEENFRVGNDDAKEQFYYFDDGSVFYVSRRITWQTVNKHRIETLDSNARKAKSTYAGLDKEGLHWKEVTLEDFKIGYAYVSPDRVETFNRALNSVKIR